MRIILIWIVVRMQWQGVDTLVLAHECFWIVKLPGFLAGWHGF
jgi:hypothetical protein